MKNKNPEETELDKRIATLIGQHLDDASIAIARELVKFEKSRRAAKAQKWLGQLACKSPRHARECLRDCLEQAGTEDRSELFWAGWTAIGHRLVDPEMKSREPQKLAGLLAAGLGAAPARNLQEHLKGCERKFSPAEALFLISCVPPGKGHKKIADFIRRRTLAQ